MLLFLRLAPPHFKLKPPEVMYVRIDDAVSLPCEAQGTPAPTTTWFKVCFI